MSGTARDPGVPASRTVERLVDSPGRLIETPARLVTGFDYAKFEAAIGAAMQAETGPPGPGD